MALVYRLFISSHTDDNATPSRLSHVSRHAMRRSNATCILFVAIVKLQCSHPVLHSKTSINTSRPYLSVYMRLNPPPWVGGLQSVFAICNCNRAILARTPPWVGGLQSVFAICNCNRAALLRSPHGRRACRVHLQSAIATELLLAPNPSWAESLQSVFAICNCN